ncbi:MAG: ATP-binding protein [Burkholderiales bacterium]|nr:ATP-binding protein [Burkholderiales bacterium]
MATASKWKPWHEVVQLRDELKTGELSLSMFAADLDEVILKKGKRPIYEDPAKFFALTYPTYNLRNLARDVVRRLAGKSDKAVRQLNLTYGGGKTHTLITLFHLVNDPASLPDLPAVEEFRTHIDLGDSLPKARVAAISFDKLDLETGMEVADPTGKMARLFHPWSILAWQLAGKKGLEILNGGKGMAERDSAPAENVMSDLLAVPNAEGVAILILLDEVLMYARQKVAGDKGWLIKLQSFFQALTQAAVKTDRCAVVASLLASDISANDSLGLDIVTALKEILKRQEEEMVEPVMKEDVAEILRRRLFKPCDPAEMRTNAITAFKGVCAHDEALKREGAAAEKTFVESYPFHPYLTNILYSNWTGLPRFQRTRGVLRLFAIALRDAAQWDTSPLVATNVFLRKKGERGLSDSLRELAGIANAQATDGQAISWEGILDRELTFAFDIQRDLSAIEHREIEQAVVTTFLHSQPIGQKASLRELRITIASTNPDRIEIEKGLSRWAQDSYWLDDKYTATEGGTLPEDWRLGNKPNLTQIHREKRRQVESDKGVIAVRLDKAIRDVKKLTEGAQTFGVRIHALPEKPADVEDDGKFHFAVLDTDAASESGKPSAAAKRFIDETTSAAKPRVYRNAVILSVPSKDGVEMVRGRIADLLAWEQVESELKDQAKRGSVDAQRMQRLTVELEKAKKLVPDAIRQAWCMMVTVSEANDIQAFKLGVTDESLFVTLKGDPRSRLQETKITAESLLPGGPYDLWKEGETLRRVKDLASAFAQHPHLPKMLNATAIVDTLVDGCVAGDFVLRLKRPDQTVRTWWRSRPDDDALKDTDLEVVLSTSAELAEIPGALLRKGVAPGLWEAKTELPLSEFNAYFAGGKVVQVDRGGYFEGQQVPKASIEVVSVAVEKAVVDGDLWLVSGPTSLFKESIPAGVLTDASLLLPPPEPIVAAAILEGNIPAAWKDNKATVAGMLSQLSSQRGKPVPWYQLQQAVDGALRARLVELDANSASWPCDSSAAAKVLLKAVAGAAAGQGGGAASDNANYNLVAIRAYLQPNELQDLADGLSSILELQAKHGIKLRFNLAVEATADGGLKPEAAAELRKALDDISDAFHG